MAASLRGGPFLGRPERPEIALTEDFLRGPAPLPLPLERRRAVIEGLLLTSAEDGRIQT